MATIQVRDVTLFVFPPEHQATLADRLPDPQLELIIFAGHNVHLELPAVVTEIIKRFLAA